MQLQSKKLAPRSGYPIFLIILSAFIIRAAYIFLLGSRVSNGDEIGYVIYSFRSIFNHFNPGYFLHGSLHMHLVTLIYICFFLVGKIIGFFASRIYFLTFFLNDGTLFFFLSRFVSAFFNLGSVYLTYRIGSGLWGKKAGIAAAFIFAAIPMSLQMARDTSGYSATVFFILLSVIFFLKLFQSLNFSSIILSALAFGLAISSDYYALILIPVYAAVLVWLILKQEKRAMLFYSIPIFFLLAFLVYLAINPYMLFNSEAFWREISSQAKAAVFSEHGHRYSYLSYLKLLTRPAYIFPSMFFILGCFYILRKKDLEGIIIMSVALINIVLFSLSKVQLPYYIYPAMPFLALVSAKAVKELVDTYKIGPVKIVLITLAFVLLCCSDYRPRLYNRQAQMAKDWFVKNIPQGSKLLVDPTTIYFAQTRLSQIIRDKDLYQEVLGRYIKEHPEEDYRIWTWNLTKDSIEIVNDEKIQYLVLPHRDYDKESDDWLARSCLFLKGFEMRKDSQWTIRIYKVIR